jgi:hypothetical protein
MIRLRVRPRGADAAFFSRDIQESRPTIFWVQTRSYWSETGLGREEWLEHAAEFAADHGLPLQEDPTGQIDYFLILGRRKMALRTVTEYQERRRRLTRVAWGNVTSWSRIALGLVIGLLLAILALLVAPWKLVLMMALAILAGLIFRQWQDRIKVLALIEAAAERCGLHSLAAGVINSARENVNLASPRPQAEMLES